VSGSRRASLLRSWRFEALLVLAGVALVALGAGSARSGSALALLPLDVALLVLAGGVVALASGADGSTRRFAACAGILLMLVAMPFTRIPSGGEVTVALALATAALTVLGLVGTRLHVTRAGIVGAVLVVALAGVTAASPDRYALLRFAPFVLAVAPLFLLQNGSDDGARRRTLRFVVVLGVAEAILAIAEPLLGSPQLWAPAKITAAGLAKTLPNPLLPELVRSQGTLGHPLTLAVLLLVAVALLVRDAAGLPARLRVVLGAVLGAGLLASGSRSSLLLAVVLVIVLVPRWRLGRHAVAVAAVVVAVVATGVVVAVPVLAGWVASGSTTHRLGALDAVPTLLRQPPIRLLLGNGWASSSRIFDQGLLQNDGLKAVDEQFVLMLSQGGLLALALLVALLVLALRGAGRALLPAVLAVAATMLVFDVLAWPSSAALTALVVGAAAAPRPRAGVLRRSRRRRGSADAVQERRAYSR
jgi:hypothetical protein